MVEVERRGAVERIVHGVMHALEEGDVPLHLGRRHRERIICRHVCPHFFGKVAFFGEVAGAWNFGFFSDQQIRSDQPGDQQIRLADSSDQQIQNLSISIRKIFEIDRFRRIRG